MLYLLLLVPLSFSKSLLSSIKFTPQAPWQEITRFGLGLGQGNFSISARFKSSSEPKNLKLNMVLYSGLKWTEDLTQLECEERLAQASSKYEISLPSSGKWSKKTGGRLIQKQSPQIFYFILADCSGSLIGKEILFDFEVVNPDNNHNSIEMIGIKNSFGVALILLLVMFGKNIWDFANVMKKDEEITGPRIWLNVAIVMMILSVLLQYIHLYVFDIDGKGLKGFEFMSEVFALLYQLSISTLLVVVASGWTIVYTRFPKPELYLPGIVVEVAIHLALIVFNWLYEIPRHSFSKYEEWSGAVIFVFRILMFLVFIRNLAKTSKHEDFKKTNYFYMFGIWASLYFLSMPVLVYGAFMFQTYQREYIVATLHLLIQIVIFYSLYRLLMVKGDLIKINKVLSMLPGARPHLN